MSKSREQDQSKKIDVEHQKSGAEQVNVINDEEGKFVPAANSKKKQVYIDDIKPSKKPKSSTE